MTEARPNVVLIHCHDLGRHLGCYGRDVSTPNIDDLADEGALFENHFVTAPQCSPSRGSLLTGLYPHVNGLMGLAHGEWELHDDVRTLPEYLADAGYETHLFGLQHVSEDPAGLGFDHVHSEGSLSPEGEPEVHERNRAHDVTDIVVDCLERGAHDDPFFASIGFFELHRIEVDDRFGFDDGRYDVPDPDEVTIPAFLPDRRGIRDDLAGMEGMLAAVDEAVGRITDTLAETGLADDTLLVFTTEHGIAFPRAKGCCFDAGIEAALLVRYPDVVEAGARYDELLSNVDVLPTVLDLVDGSAPEDVNGRSFRPLVAGGNYRPREQVFAEMTWHDRYNPIRSIRTRDHKYVRNFWHLPSVYLSNDVFVSEAGREIREEYHSSHRAYEELYDLREDPIERTNLADEADHETVRSELEDRLIEWMRRTDDPLLDGPIPPADYDAIEPWSEGDQEE